jgi:hypothetical protein
LIGKPSFDYTLFKAKIVQAEIVSRLPAPGEPYSAGFFRNVLFNWMITTGSPSPA